MKRFASVLAIGIAVSSFTGCAEKESSVDSLVIGKNSASASLEEAVSPTQAASWTTKFQKTNPKETGATFTDANVYKRLLGQQGCTGLRVYNATNAQAENTFVEVSVNANGDIPNGDVADEGHKAPPYSYRSILHSGTDAIMPPVLPAGALIPLSRATTMIKQFRTNNPNNMHAGYFSADTYNRILSQEGSIGIRTYKGLNDEGQELLVLVGVAKDGSDNTSGILVAAPMSRSSSGGDILSSSAR